MQLVQVLPFLKNIFLLFISLFCLILPPSPCSDTLLHPYQLLSVLTSCRLFSSNMVSSNSISSSPESSPIFGNVFSPSVLLCVDVWENNVVCDSAVLMTGLTDMLLTAVAATSSANLPFTSGLSY